MPATFENVSPDGAVDGQCWIETLSPDLCLANSAKKERWRTWCATRGAKTTWVGVAAIGPSHLHSVSSIAAIYARCPLHVCSKSHNFEMNRGVTLGGPLLAEPGAKSLGAPVWNWLRKSSGKGLALGGEKLFTEATLLRGQSSYAGPVKSPGR